MALPININGSTVEWVRVELKEGILSQKTTMKFLSNFCYYFSHISPPPLIEVPTGRSSC